MNLLPNFRSKLINSWTDLPQILRKIMGIFRDWLKYSNLSGSTHIYKQSCVPELVKHINAYCCKSASLCSNLQTTFELNMAEQLHVANYINIQNGGYLG